MDKLPAGFEKNKVEANRMNRINISTNTPWEESVGYSRVVRIGPHIYVSGTVAADENGHIQGEGDAYLQAKFILGKIENALAEVNANMGDVVRVRVYLATNDAMEGVSKAHHEYFHAVRPANTTVVVAGLANEACLVEIEVEALVLNANDQLSR